MSSLCFCSQLRFGVAEQVAHEVLGAIAPAAIGDVPEVTPLAPSGGLVFAQLLPVSPQAAYLGSLSFPAALAVLGALIAGRATEPVPITPDAPEAGQAGVT